MVYSRDIHIKFEAIPYSSFGGKKMLNYTSVIVMHTERPAAPSGHSHMANMDT